MSRLSTLQTLIALQFFPVPTCASGCDTDLPEVDFDDCTPKINYSEIRRIFMAKTTMEPFTNWKLAAEWLERISESGTTDNAIRVLTVIGDKPAGTPISKEISNGRRITIGKDHTLNFTIDDVSDANYEAMRVLECGGEYLMWYETEGEKMFGGNGGIRVRVDVNNVLGRGREEIEVINGSFSWRAKFHPERATSPIFGTGTAGSTYDTTLTFASSTTDTDGGVDGEAASTNANLEFRFNAVPDASGTPSDMSVTVGGTEVLTITYPSEYEGAAYELKHTDGTIKHGVFDSPTSAAV